MVFIYAKKYAKNEKPAKNFNLIWSLRNNTVSNLQEKQQCNTGRLINNMKFQNPKTVLFPM